MSTSTIKPIAKYLSKVSYSGWNILKNSPVLVAQCRCKSDHWNISTIKEKVNDKISLTTLQNDSPSKERPLVLLFGWLLAKPRHLQKYANLYHSKGCDVLTIQTKPLDVLWPARSQDTMEVALDLLSQPRLAEKPLMVHGFSVGGYLYGEMLVKLNADQAQWGSVSQRLEGQIFDSPVDFDNVPIGLSLATFNNKESVAQRVFKASIEKYLSLMHNKVTKDYIRSSEAFQANDLHLPSLLLYSHSDPIGVSDKIEQVMHRWRSQGVKVYGRDWQSSPHVSHFHRHPDEYVEAMIAFMEEIDLPRSKKQEKVKKATQRSSRPSEVQQAL